MAINETLRKVGLNDKEIKVYLTLLKNGKMRPSLLSRATKINRATVYNLGRGLLSKGMIAEDVSGKILYFVPLPPESLSRLIEDSKREIEVRAGLVKQAISELGLITAEKEYPVPRMVFVEESDLEKFLYDNMAKWFDAVIAGDGVWWGFQDHSFVENYEEWIHATWETSQSRNSKYRGQVFSNASKIEQKMEQKYFRPKRNIRFMEGANFTATTWVCGDYLIMINTRRHPFYLIEINDHTLAHNTMEVFRRLWDLGETRV